MKQEEEGEGHEWVRKRIKIYSRFLHNDGETRKIGFPTYSLMRSFLQATLNFLTYVKLALKVEGGEYKVFFIHSCLRRRGPYDRRDEMVVCY